MSELVAVQHDRTIRHLLLGGASAIALLTGLSSSAALADDTNHFSIELGGQYGIESGGSTDWFGNPFSGGEGALYGVGPDTFKIKPKHSWNIDGAIKLRPADSDLILKLGVQYGRTARESKDVHFSYLTSTDGGDYYYITGKARHKEEHYKIDFQVGKDFGLGMFGNNGGTSIFSVGIRYAHFNARTNVRFYTSSKYNRTAQVGISRSFSGVGPMISWEASAPISDDGFALDWGAEAAVLFGKQKVHINASYTFDTGYSYSTSGEHKRNRTVPEVGGFMGVSWTCPDACAKITFGYKVDALFHLYDGGFITPRDSDRVTHGPFLKVGLDVN